MDISEKGLEILQEREGTILHAYQDSRGIWTIGTGHTAFAGAPYPVPGMTITPADAEQILHRDLAPCIETLNLCGQMTQYQFDAGVSLIFNIGAPSFRGSTFRRMLIAKNFNAAARSILLWNEPPSIRSRREGEYVQFLHGEYVARIEP